MLNPRIARAARALLGWSQTDLARAAGLGRSTITDLENESRNLPDETELKIRRAFETAGLTFVFDDGEGIHLKRKGRR